MMAATACLQNLPVEIVENVVTWLSLEDARNLRLASRLLASKVSEGSFKSYYRIKRLDLTRESLERFVQATKPECLGSNVQEVVLVGIAVDTTRLEAILREKGRWVSQANGPMVMSTKHTCTTEELEQVQQDLNDLQRKQSELAHLREQGADFGLLREAFENLQTDGKAAVGLRSVTLEVGVLRGEAETAKPPAHGGKWEVIWKTAAWTFEAVAISLSQSGLKIGRFNVFESQQRCSLAVDEFSRILTQIKGFMGFARGLTALSLSLSCPVIQETRPREPGDITANPAKTRVEIPITQLQTLATDEKNFHGLSILLASTPNLQSLAIHWSILGYHLLARDDFREERLLQSLADADNLSHLKTCSLRGMRATEDAFLGLLRKHPIRDISLQNLQLTNGTFRSIFDHCTSDETALEALYFDDLFEDAKQVYFDDGGKPKFPRDEYTYGSNTLIKQGEEVRAWRPIVYHFHLSRALGSYPCYIWRKHRDAEYGPP